MAIGDFEREVLRLIAANRHPESFIAGATIIHQAPDTPRASEDIDIFHDAPGLLLASSQGDAELLRGAGYTVDIDHTLPNFIRAWASRGGEKTKIEWVFDSAFRFFPIEPDVDLGWRLNFWDAATNKVLALCARAKLRDMLDTLYLDEYHLCLGGLAWAAGGKDPGLTPEIIVILARRFAIFRETDVSQLRLSRPVDLRALKMRWMEASEKALQLFPRLPPTELGCLYLDASGKPVCPDPEAPDFAQLTRHYGTLRGAWPRIVED